MGREEGRSELPLLFRFVQPEFVNQPIKGATGDTEGVRRIALVASPPSSHFLKRENTGSLSTISRRGVRQDSRLENSPCP